jgi:uncharacterized membrane protein YfcA
MISLTLAIALAATILGTAFISGIFGMAGGMILIGILLVIMPVAAAMVLHGVTQMASNGWRAWLWRTHIQWPIVAWYGGGAVVATLIFCAAQVAPGKPLTLVVLGLLSLAGLLMPSRFAPDILRRGDAIGCGVLCTSLQLVAGVSGPIFDVFFVRSEMGRKEVVATKAAIQSLGHFLKVAYFGQLLTAGGSEVAPWAVAIAVVMAMSGTQLSRKVLDAISDAQFRSWTRALIATLAILYLVHGVVLLVTQTGLG